MLFRTLINNLKIREIPFTEEQLVQTKKIWNLLSKIEDKIYVRVNFHGEIFADRWAKECAFYINKISIVKSFEIITINSIPPKNYMKSKERRVGKECRSRWSPDH